jgi:hypothetical protein
MNDPVYLSQLPDGTYRITLSGKLIGRSMSKLRVIYAQKQNGRWSGLSSLILPQTSVLCSKAESILNKEDHTLDGLRNTGLDIALSPFRRSGLVD